VKVLIVELRKPLCSEIFADATGELFWYLPVNGCH